MRVRAWGVAHSATPQYLVMCFASQEPDPISCKQQAKTLVLLPKEREFPRQTGRVEEQIAAKKFRIWERFLDFKHLQNYNVDADSLVGCS